MFYSKWTFSLTSLVIILVLSLVAPSAMSAEFGVTLGIGTAADNLSNPDVSSADGIQLERDDTAVITIKTDKVVQIAAAASADQATARGASTIETLDFEVIGYNEFGGTVATVPVLGAVTNATTPDGKNFTMTLAAPTEASLTRIIIAIPKHAIELADPRAELDDDGARKAEGKSAAASIEIHYVAADGVNPTVYSIRRADDPLLPVTASTVNVIIVLSEQPKEFKKDHVDVSNATWGDPVALVAIDEDEDGIDNSSGTTTGDTVDDMPSTGRDDMLYPYVLVVTPKYENKDDIVVKVKAFSDMVLPTAMMYTPPATEAGYMEGMSKLTIKVGKEAPAAKDAGLVVNLPKEKRIPKDGYLVIATKIAESGVADNPENDKDEPKASARTPAQLLYNAIEVGLPNLETFLANGGIIDVVGPEKVVISEIMWGTDASLKPNNNSQWIELKNKSGKSLLTGEDNYQLIFYGPNESPPAKTAAVAATATTEAKPAALPEGVMDRVGTIDEKGAYWSIVGKGQSGRSGLEEQAADIVAVVPTQSIISMYRVADAKGLPMNGQMASSWMQSTPPGINFDLSKVGVRVGSPGAAPHITAAQQKALDDAAAAKAKADAAKADTSVSMPAVGQIYISEIMVAGGGTLPQWIEISNGSRTEQVNLSGWTITVDNAAADADVSVGASIKFTIPEGTKIDPSGQNDTPSTVLVVTEAGRNNVDGSGQVLNLWTANQTELILAGVTKRRYSLLSDMAFQITLAPPAPKKTNVAGLAATATAAQKAAAQAADAKVALAHKAATDTVGNLGADGAAAWALPMSEEGGRSSLIRRHVPVSVGPAEPEMGTMMDSWALASDTSFAQVTHIRASSYYGAMNDVGTPGFRAGGALPVELSHFRPVRNKETGQVVITWSTQSELNNAGFFIKRSNQKDGEFKVINAAMIAGAGTTSEKQFYTYTDTTAQPNVVYYYQIEDVSLDGNRQTLTRGIRLKGHIGAAGKATTTWGDLKTQE